MLPDKPDEKTGEVVFAVLKSKRPETRVPGASAMEGCNATRDLVDAGIAEGAVKKVSQRLAGSAAPGGGRIWLHSNSGCSALEVPVNNCVRLRLSALFGWQTSGQSGPRAEPRECHDAHDWAMDLGKVSVQSGLQTH